MLVIISPAKTLDYSTPVSTDSYSLPGYLDDSIELIQQLRRLSPAEVSSLMNISDKLGGLNFGRYLDWQPEFNTNNARQSILAFKGEVYAGLDAASLSGLELQWAQNHLRILSGLYGLLRPLDLIQPYRLEMGTKLPTSRGSNLYEFWGNKITEGLNQILDAEKSQLIINLASSEYFRAIRTQSLKANIVSPVFKDWKNDSYKIISFFAKKARGMMSRFIIENQIHDPEKIKSFVSGGYRFDPVTSTPNEWVFTRKLME
jgi:uncharacterized protein|tara:strand:+ start:4598 stop:5374 length:777 start_codon:yes stop_codon:yes gene_type:complete